MDERKGRQRAVHFPKLGQYFRKLRGKVKQRELVRLAAARGLTLGYQTIRDLESGKIQHLSPALLATLAKLYGIPYDVLVTRYVEAAYHQELTASTRKTLRAGQSPALLSQGGTDVASRTFQIQSEAFKTLRHLDAALAACIKKFVAARIEIRQTLAIPRPQSHRHQSRRRDDRGRDRDGLTG